MRRKQKPLTFVRDFVPALLARLTAVEDSAAELPEPLDSKLPVVNSGSCRG